MKRKVPLVLALTVAIALLFVSIATATTPIPSNCTKVDVTDSWKEASGSVASKCPGAYVTSLCGKGGSDPDVCSSNDCYTINYSGPNWSISENWPADDKGPECKDLSHYTVCWDCPPPLPDCGEACTDECKGDLVCQNGTCVNLDCPEDEDCVCTPTPGCWSKCAYTSQCPEGLQCLGGHCVDPYCPEERNCDCDPCCPRGEVVLTGCVPTDITVSVSQWIDFPEVVGGEPQGDKRNDQRWGGKTLIYDLVFDRPYRYWIWLESGEWLYVGDIKPTEECPKVYQLKYNFPCPVPLPPELPETGYAPPPTVNPSAAISAIAGILMAIGGVRILLRRH